jgi:catechol 2,3-dioxygenase-like lactoylglutathione lyase family enzyme
MTWIQHIGITCKDIEKSKKFYIENFDFKVVREFDVPEKDINQIFGINSDAHIVSLKGERDQEIELFSFSGKEFCECTGNISHFALFVSKRKETAEKIKATGFETIIVDRGEGREVYFVKDPDGVLIELKE